jgi:hypothetical protein
MAANVMSVTGSRGIGATNVDRLTVRDTWLGYASVGGPFDAVNLAGVTHAELRHVEAVGAANRIVADSATGFLRLDGCTYTTLSSSAKATEVTPAGAPRSLPALTTTQRDALSGMAAGSLVYNTTTAAVDVYGGSAWAAVGPGVSSPLTVAVLQGSTASGGNLTIRSTGNPTKGKTTIGPLTVDEANGRVGVGLATTPLRPVHVAALGAGQATVMVENTNAAGGGKRWEMSSGVDSVHDGYYGIRNQTDGVYVLMFTTTGTPIWPGLVNAADDAAAAAAGVPLNGLYRTAGAPKIRVS